MTPTAFALFWGRKKEACEPRGNIFLTIQAGTQHVLFDVEILITLVFSRKSALTVDIKQRNLFSSFSQDSFILCSSGSPTPFCRVVVLKASPGHHSTHHLLHLVTKYKPFS